MREVSNSAPLEARRSLSIVLIRPATVGDAAKSDALYELPPLGLAYVAAALKRAGHRVRLIDAFGEQPEQLVHHGEGIVTKGLTAGDIVVRIPHDVDLIGFACMFSNSWFYCRTVIAEVAAAFPGVPIVVGGEHATADYQRLLRRVPEVHCCVLGEGEDTAIDIAAHLSHGLPLDRVPGIALRDAAGEVVTTLGRRRILAIDSLAWPAWEMVPIATYLERRFSHDSYLTSTMPMLASRGCPYQCTFCSSPQMLGTKWLARSPRAVVDEMRHYHHTYGARYFEFHDLTMIVRREWILEFCQLLVAERMDVQWAMPSGTRSEALDAEVLGWMKRAGCRAFTYAPESGSPEELRRIKKKVSLPRMLESMRAAARIGLVTRCNVIFGLPDQTKRDVLASMGLVVRLAWVGAHDLGCYVFSPYPGSALYERLVAEGRIDPEAAGYDRSLAGILCTDFRMRRSFTPHVPAWSLTALCVGMTALFYGLQFLFRPQRVVSLLRNVARRQPETFLQRVLNRKLSAGRAPRRAAEALAGS